MALAFVDRLPRVSDPPDEMCDICIRKYGTTVPGSDEPAESAVRLECNHVFGSYCMGKWLSLDKGRNKCPACRRILFHWVYAMVDEEDVEDVYGWNNEQEAEEHDAGNAEGYREEQDVEVENVEYPQYDDEDFAIYIERFDDDLSHFLKQMREGSNFDRIFNPAVEANEGEEPKPSRDRQDWNEQWRIILDSLHAKSEGFWDQQWQSWQQWLDWHQEWIFHAMHHTNIGRQEAETVLKRVRKGLPVYWQPAFYINDWKIAAMAAARATLHFREYCLYWQLLGGPSSEQRQFRSPPAFLTDTQQEELFQELQRRKAFYPIVRQGKQFWSEIAGTAESWDTDYLCENHYGLSERQQWTKLREEGLVYHLESVDGDGGESWHWSDWPYVPFLAITEQQSLG